jgi:AraC-like DNA-binding protein
MATFQAGLTAAEIAPLLRGANLLVSRAIEFGLRHNYAYQILYLFDGEAKARIDGSRYVLGPGDLALYAPDHGHYFKTRPHSTVFTVCFSWNQATATCLETGNRNVDHPDVEFRAQADPPVHVQGLPEFPFVTPLDLETRAKLEPLMREIGRSFSSSASLGRMRLRGLMLELLHGLITSQQSKPASHAVSLINRLHEYLGQHYNEPLDRRVVSQALGISESYLTALLRTRSNTNFTDCLTTIRMSKAQELLQFSTLSVKEIAAVTGFHNASYFVARFKKRHGVSPGQFRG